jgi:hypothetical protein
MEPCDVAENIGAHRSIWSTFWKNGRLVQRSDTSTVFRGFELNDLDDQTEMVAC